MPGREVVLDAETGLPEVRASRTEEGHLTFRMHTVRAGGMSVWEPINDAALRSLRERFGAEDEDWSARIRSAAAAAAESIRTADQQRAVQLSELEVRLEAQGEILEEERAKRAEAEEQVHMLQGRNQGSAGGARSAATKRTDTK